MKETRSEVTDRIMIILEVFEKHAGSKEAKLQIELARTKHLMPLMREIINNAKRGELPGFLAGGVYAIDKYYLFMKKKAAKIKRELEYIRRKRGVTRVRRNLLGLPTVSIIGYANAGKTTLFNNLTGYEKPVGEKPFTTLLPKTGRIKGGKKILLIDTVGFIVKVPPEIIEAFYSTLEEIVYSKLLYFVLDASEDSNIIIKRVNEAAATLGHIGALYKPLIIVMNKKDLLNPKLIMEKKKRIMKESIEKLPNTINIIPVSAEKKLGLEKLVNETWKHLFLKQESLE